MCPVPTNDMQSADLPTLSFDSTFMKVAQCAERMKKLFSDFCFLSYRENSSKIDSFQNKNDHNSKNEYRKNPKFDSSFYSANSELPCKFDQLKKKIVLMFAKKFV